MGENTGRGYDLPLIIHKWNEYFRFFLILLTVLFFEHEVIDSGDDIAVIWFMRILLYLLVCLALIDIARCHCKVHLVTEGVAVTLFGRTIHRIPRAQLRQILGVLEISNQSTEKWIVLSSVTLGELAEFQASRTRKMFLNGRSHPRWAEDLGEKYFRRYFNSWRRIFGIRQHDMILLQWSPDRLDLIQRMYPEVPWRDLTEKEILSHRI